MSRLQGDKAAAMRAYSSAEALQSSPSISTRIRSLDTLGSSVPGGMITADIPRSEAVKRSAAIERRATRGHRLRPSADRGRNKRPESQPSGK